MMPLFIASEIARHNQRQRTLAGVYGVIAVLLWLVSCIILVILIDLPLALFGLHPPLWVLLLGPAAGVILLAYDGMRYSRKLFDIDEYRSSIYGFNPFGSDKERIDGLIMANYVPSPSAAIVEDLAIAFMVSQTLFCAPRFTAKAYRAAQNHVHMDAMGIDMAQRFIDQLAVNGGPWVNVSDHPDAMDVMSDLEQMGITESRIDGDRVQVRIIPEVRRKHYQSHQP